MHLIRCGLMRPAMMLALGCEPALAQTHLSRVQSLRLDSLVQSDLVAYYSKGRENRARGFATLIGGVVAYYS
jgi:hypothetical protein